MNDLEQFINTEKSQTISNIITLKSFIDSPLFENLHPHIQNLMCAKLSLLQASKEFSHSIQLSCNL